MKAPENSGLIAKAPDPAVRVLVLGCGSIGKRHIRNLKLLNIKDIIAVDVRDDRRREVGRQFGVPTFADLDSGLRQNATAALICTPTRLHIQHALTAARAGFHLFIEKPISDSLEGVDELIREIGRRGLKSVVGCNFRFDSGLRHVKRLLDEGAIGVVVSARAQFGQYLPDWHPYEDYRLGYSARRELGGGVVLDRIHEVDYLTWLLGEVTEVYAMVGRLSNLEVNTEDTAEILLRFATGAFGSIHLDYVRRRYDCNVEIVGDAGIIHWCYQDRSVRWYVAREGTWHTLQWPSRDGNEMYLAEMQHAVGVFQGQEKPELDARGGRRVLAIALAAKRAAKERKAIAVRDWVF